MCAVCSKDTGRGAVYCTSSVMAPCSQPLLLLLLTHTHTHTHTYFPSPRLPPLPPLRSPPYTLSPFPPLPPFSMKTAAPNGFSAHANEPTNVAVEKELFLLDDGGAAAGGPAGGQKGSYVPIFQYRVSEEVLIKGLSRLMNVVSGELMPEAHRVRRRIMS